MLSKLDHCPGTRCLSTTTVSNKLCLTRISTSWTMWLIDIYWLYQITSLTREHLCEQCQQHMLQPPQPPSQIQQQSPVSTTTSITNSPTTFNTTTFHHSHCHHLYNNKLVYHYCTSQVIVVTHVTNPAHTICVLKKQVLAHFRLFILCKSVRQIINIQRMVRDLASPSPCGLVLV